MRRRKRWLRRFTGGAALAGLLAGAGCSSMDNTEKGAGVGAGVGAGIGALAGSTSGHAGKGALIGGAAGALLGGAVGHDADKQEKRALEAQVAAQQQVRGPLSLPEVVNMARSGVSDPLIIQQIRTTGSCYNLSPDDIIWLRSNGVSDGVISEMQATRYRPRTVVVAPPPPVVQPVYVVPEPTPPPVAVGIGFRVH
jgi:hypothetical protein